MTRAAVDAILHAALPVEDGRTEEAWAALKPLEHAAETDPEAAWGLAVAITRPELGLDRRLMVAQALLLQWPEHDDMLLELSEAAETLRPYSYLNAAPPEDPFFERLAKTIEARISTATDTKLEARLNEALATACRVLGRKWDDVCDAAHRRALALRPDRWQGHYNYGLFLKTRGRFEEGMSANRRAAELAPQPVESIEWNLGICATGANDGQAAFDVWTRMGNKLTLDDGGLPEGGYHTVQVRLAQHPLAERTADHDAPGPEETIWIERLSPCHGRVRSALFHDDIGVDFGDLVLFDGAPIKTRRWGERMVPVFSHLSTLKRAGWRIFRFAGTQAREGQVGDLDDVLPDDATIYVHTERFKVVCRECWENESIDHEGHDDDGDKRTIVRGKLCFAPDVDPLAIIERLDDASAKDEVLSVLVPDLHEALGNSARARAERRRIDLLVDS